MAACRGRGGREEVSGSEGPRSLIVFTALRFTREYGASALRSAASRGEDVVLCLVADRETPDAVSDQLADTGFVGERLAHDLKETMTTEYRARGAAYLEELVRGATDLGLAVESRVVDGPFVEAILEVARQTGVDRILAPRMREVFFASEVDRLARRAPCPVDRFEASGAPVSATAEG